MTVRDPAQDTSDYRKDETRLWLSVLDAYNFVYPELNRQLKERSGISVSKFDVLAQLKRYPDGLSMGDLSARLKVSNGNVSGLVNRLRKDGLVDRSMSAEDRRSFVAVLTDAGQQRFEEAAKVHAAVLSECFRHLNAEDLAETTGVLKAIIRKPRDKGIPAND
ncbi:MarR family winged helix-turn-helix transcriptional regulator [Sagittula stellata]|uniref:Transcriptional regulator, MarR family protein n=1 Tax=Sagittula stellata (strain ATCC 700073 / DSM 11524 / E-37) TaxID=388399 RepID=A3K7T9_SAGS3|nr:MarR family transcriptional regulator [Sagittula stellata]EBA06711.1 transcriptional regulator, MarR family protein [Sagittula stellata E-37]